LVLCVQRQAAAGVFLSFLRLSILAFENAGVTSRDSCGKMHHGISANLPFLRITNESSGNEPAVTEVDAISPSVSNCTRWQFRVCAAATCIDSGSSS
jgi:hypothetical protein